jgi:tripartite-type tricarboxylate transporter receptor subunit TctC
MWNTMLRFLAVIVGVSPSLALVAPPAAAQVNFARQTIDFTIPFGVGGGSDQWARVYQPYLSKHLPGNPTIVVKNIPGGGGITGANQFVARARTNGLDILGTSGSNQIPYLLGDKQVRYEYRDLFIVLGSPVGGVVYISPKTGVKTLADLKNFKGDLQYASQGATSLDLVPLLAFETLGLKVKGIMGYKGRGPGRVAFEQGEVNIDYQTTAAYLQSVKPLIEAGTAVPLFSFGHLDDNNRLVRDPVAPDVPHFAEAYEAIHGKKPSGPAFEAWKAFFIAGFALQKPIWLPKGTPADVVKVYRDAAHRIVKDPAFQKDLKDKLGGYPQYVGEHARKAFEEALNVSPDSIRWLKKWLAERFEVKL